MVRPIVSSLLLSLGVLLCVAATVATPPERCFVFTTSQGKQLGYEKAAQNPGNKAPDNGAYRVNFKYHQWQMREEPKANFCVEGSKWAKYCGVPLEVNKQTQQEAASCKPTPEKPCKLKKVRNQAILKIYRDIVSQNVTQADSAAACAEACDNWDPDTKPSGQFETSTPVRTRRVDLS